MKMHDTDSEAAARVRNHAMAKTWDGYDGLLSFSVADIRALLEGYDQLKNYTASLTERCIEDTAEIGRLRADLDKIGCQLYERNTDCMHFSEREKQLRADLDLALHTRKVSPERQAEIE